MKTRALAMSLLFALAATPALAQTSPPANAEAPGLLRIDVDARDLARRIFKVTATVPAKPGPMTLLYPQWIPGNHSPTGPIDKLAGLRVTANGKPLAWQRDQFNVYAFKVNVPEGVSEIVAHFDFLSSQGGSQGRVVMTPEMLNLQWNANSLYPAGVDARNLQAQASVTLPRAGRSQPRWKPRGATVTPWCSSRSRMTIWSIRPCSPASTTSASISTRARRCRCTSMCLPTTPSR